MERMAKHPSFLRGFRILAAAALLGLVGCSGDDGGGTGTGGAGGHAGASGGSGGKGGSISSTGGKGGSTGGTAGQSATGGTAGTGTGGTVATGGTAGTGTGGSAGTGEAGMDGGTGGSAGMDGGIGGSAGGIGGAGAMDAGSDASPDGGNGNPCSANSQCPSNFCVDGVCCESACNGACSACSNAKTGQADGLCRPISAGTDPDDECPASGASTCGMDGVCDGAGACRKWAAGTICAAESCSGVTDTPPRTCNGSGTCQTVTNTTCGNYVCGTTNCKTSCSGNSDCASGNVCSLGHCVAPQAVGAACGAAGECSSGFCVDGVCCEATCDAGCFACSNAKTGQANGHCAAITAGTDPDNECTQEAASTCGHDGMCDGAGACRLYGATTVCAGETCSAGLDTPARLCDGAGACLPAGNGTSCGAYMCGASTCETGCSANTDCASGYFCSAGMCVVLETNGTACGSNNDCMSGFCVDNVCCNSACTGSCMSCTATGTVGQCSPADAGSDPHNDCTPDAASTCGHDGTCDGAGACRLYASGTVCHAAGCSTATVSAASTCNGLGVCQAGGTTSCNAYQCDSSGAAMCGTSCTSDANCTGFCAAGACYASPVNLAGNGDVEYDSAVGWTSNGAGTTIASGTGLAHGGLYSMEATGRTASYMGPAYPFPTGPGVYTVSAWAMQKDVASLSGALQVALNCAGGFQDYPTIQAYGIPLTYDSTTGPTWVHISGTVDTSADAACQPGNATPGVVTSATLYLNQTAGSTFPNLYLDDVVIQAPTGLNLIGNPNFEAGSTAGWQNNGGGALNVVTTVFKGGTHSLAHTGRTATYQGPRWNLPIGPAKYTVTINALHNGANPHDLMITPTYTCVGGTAQFGAAVATASQASANGWYTLTGTVTFPPASASGCQLSAAGVYVQQEYAANGCGTGSGQTECPDLFIDDASIALAP
jgi:hypothetical protein